MCFDLLQNMMIVRISTNLKGDNNGVVVEGGGNTCLEDFITNLSDIRAPIYFMTAQKGFTSRTICFKNIF